MERGTMFCIFQPWSLNVYIYAEKTIKQLLRLSTEDKTCERLSSGRCHIHAQVYTCHQAWGCILRAQEIGYSVVFFSLWTIPSLLFTSYPPLSATHQFTTSFHLSRAPQGLKAIANQMQCFPKYERAWHIQTAGHQFNTSDTQGPTMQPGKDPSKIIFPALWSGLPELPDLLWYQQDKEQEIRFPNTLSSCLNHAAVEPGTRTPHP